MTGGHIYEALENPRALQKYVEERTPGRSQGRDGEAWLIYFFESVNSCFGTIVLPDILPRMRAMIRKMVANPFTNFVLLQQHKVDDMTDACV